MYRGYFDESGDLEAADKIFCVAGYYVEAANAERMDAEWLKVLNEYGLPHFHMVDCAHGNEEFKRIEKEERSELVIKLIKIIKDYTSHGFAAIASGDHFVAEKDRPDVYSECVELCISALQVFLLSNRLEGETVYFFETGHKSRGDAYNHVARRIGELSSSIAFGMKDQVRLLQAADLLAWQTAKYAKDIYGQKRPPRKDFMSLLEHPHTLAFLTVKGSEKQIAFEDWPLSRRGVTTILVEAPRRGRLQSGMRLAAKCLSFQSIS
jgi:hypothetical protein